MLSGSLAFSLFIAALSWRDDPVAPPARANPRRRVRATAPPSTTNREGVHIA